MEKILKTGCGIIAGVLIASIAGLVIYFFYLNSWFNKVQKELPFVKQELFELNHESLTQIPISEGVIEVIKEDLGMKSTFYYGGETKVYYQVSDVGLDVQAFYQSTLESLGWQLNSTYVDTSETWYSNRYSFKETCLEIETNLNYPGRYTIYLYHDFAAQKVIPELPPMWYVNFRHMGKTNRDVCP